METTPKQERSREVPTLALVIALVLCMGVGGILGHVVAERRLERKAIQNGAAYHDPQTGAFTWIERPVIVIQKTKVMRRPDGTIYKENMEDDK
jgi:hypothetical protein